MVMHKNSFYYFHFHMSFSIVGFEKVYRDVLQVIKCKAVQFWGYAPKIKWNFVFIFFYFFRIWNSFGLNITEETLLVEMRIWFIKIGIVLILHLWNVSLLKGRICHIRPFMLIFTVRNTVVCVTYDLSYLRVVDTTKRYYSFPWKL